MQRMPSRPHNADKSSAGNDQPIEETLTSSLEKSVVDDLSMGFADFEALKGR